MLYAMRINEEEAYRNEEKRADEKSCLAEGNAAKRNLI